MHGTQFAGKQLLPPSCFISGPERRALHLQCTASQNGQQHPRGIIPPQRQYAAETLHERSNGVERRVAGQEPLVEVYADEAVQAASSHGKHRHSSTVSVRRGSASNNSNSSNNGKDPNTHKGLSAATAIDYEQLFSASGRARGPDALAAMAHLSDTNNIQVRMHGGLPAASSFPFESFSYKLRTGTSATVDDPGKVCRQGL